MLLRLLITLIADDALQLSDLSTLQTIGEFRVLQVVPQHGYLLVHVLQVLRLAKQLLLLRRILFPLGYYLTFSLFELFEELVVALKQIISRKTGFLQLLSIIR